MHVRPRPFPLRSSRPAPLLRRRFFLRHGALPAASGALSLSPVGLRRHCRRSTVFLFCLPGNFPVCPDALSAHSEALNVCHVASALFGDALALFFSHRRFSPCPGMLLSPPQQRAFSSLRPGVVTVKRAHQQHQPRFQRQQASALADRTLSATFRVSISLRRQNYAAATAAYVRRQATATSNCPAASAVSGCSDGEEPQQPQRIVRSRMSQLVLQRRASAANYCTSCCSDEQQEQQ